MARKVLKSADGEGFLRAYWDLLGDMREVYQVDVAITVTCSKRRGILMFLCRAYSTADVPPGPPQAAYTAEYPTSQVGSLEAFLYRCALKLDYQLEMQKKYPMGKA